MNALAPYEAMRALSTRMVEAAQGCDWDRLVKLERDCASLARQLESVAAAPRLTEAERAHKSALIRQILADDAEVRRHTEPWMEHVKLFLGGGARERSMRRAYGAHSGQ